MSYLPLQLNISKTGPSSCFQTHFLSLLIQFCQHCFCVSPRQAYALRVVFEICSVSPAQWSTRVSSTLCFPAAAAQLWSHGLTSATAFQSVSASVLPLLQASAVCIAGLTFPKWHLPLHYQLRCLSIAHGLSSEIHVPFLALKALHDWYQPSSLTSPLCKRVLCNYPSS